MKPPKQDKFSRYVRHIQNSNAPYWMTNMALCIRHFPPQMRQWASDKMMLMTIQGGCK